VPAVPSAERGKIVHAATLILMAREPLPEARTLSPPPLDIERTRHEQQLIAAVLAKDRKATAEFVSRYADAVYAYVRHRLAPRADLVEDLVQDVFLAALASLANFAGSSSLQSWLLGIARHKVEDHYRRLLREPERLADSGEPAEPQDDGPLLDEQIDRQRLHEKTQRILRMLPEPYSVALLWRYWENRSVRDMAAATGRTEKAIERLLARARARFRQLWGEV
jgi:RNA polymerase sigma-70 factor (ECF subfamily)